MRVIRFRFDYFRVKNFDESARCSQESDLIDRGSEKFDRGSTKFDRGGS